ncbi:MAG TPA: DUF3006 domain-containing protein [Gemmatimonadales bacterium]|nr:DUF3006 domain-containing protein [Gemmatimonadales bacterium]
MTTAFYAVDRLEGKFAVVVGDDGKMIDVERSELPKQVREGSVLRVRTGATGPDWSSAEIDRAEEERRRASARKILDELKRSDPGGDIQL